jgi:hypothetical protein
LIAPQAAPPMGPKDIVSPSFKPVAFISSESLPVTVEKKP